MLTSAQVVEVSVNVTNNSPSHGYSHSDDQTTQMTETPGFKPFTIYTSDKRIKTSLQRDLFEKDKNSRRSEFGKN